MCALAYYVLGGSAARRAINEPAVDAEPTGAEVAPPSAREPALGDVPAFTESAI